MRESGEMDCFKAAGIVTSRLRSLDPKNALAILEHIFQHNEGKRFMILLASTEEDALFSYGLNKVRLRLGLLPSPLNPLPISIPTAEADHSSSVEMDSAMNTWLRSIFLCFPCDSSLMEEDALIDYFGRFGRVESVSKEGMYGLLKFVVPVEPLLRVLDVDNPHIVAGSRVCIFPFLRRCEIPPLNTQLQHQNQPSYSSIVRRPPRRNPPSYRDVVASSDPYTMPERQQASKTQGSSDGQ